MEASLFFSLPPVNYYILGWQALQEVEQIKRNAKYLLFKSCDIKRVDHKYLLIWLSVDSRQIAKKKKK